MRFHHYSIRTERAYLQWIRRFLLFHRATHGQETETAKGGWRHPRAMSALEVREFLSDLALRQNGARRQG